MSIMHCRWTIVWKILAACIALLASLCAGGAEHVQEGTVSMWVEPLTRYIHVTYQVPADAPDELTVLCSWSPAGQDDWRPARVTPLVSETALRLASDQQWSEWLEGRVTERRAAGLERTVVFNPYPEAQQAGRVDVDFRILLLTPEGRELAAFRSRLEADNSDVVYIEDWSQVLQKGAVAPEAESEGRKWSWRTDQDESAQVTFGNDLYGRSLGDVPLPQLTYPLNLRGTYAIFVYTRPRRGLKLRLTGDERADMLIARRPFQEVFWRWCPMDRQHLVLKQGHAYTGYSSAEIDYVKLVPLSDELVASLEALYSAKQDKIVAGYWEPYSWAFNEDVQETLQHREPLAAFAQARVPIIDIQLGRIGAKVVYESRVTDQLIYSTYGDPIGNVAQPETDNVGRMQQYTNTLQAELRYARELGLSPQANFGATICYPGTPLQGDFSKEHPDWMRRFALRYEVPQVQRYILRLYRETLEIGAPALSIDYCRYPEGIDKAETCNEFMRKLRRLADSYGRRRGKHITISVRFPAIGVRSWENFDYKTWVKEGLVDYLCPSNIQDRHLNFDIAPYVEAVAGSKCKLLPCVEGGGGGLQMPGMFLQRVRQLYEAGADGIYIYQCDARVMGWPSDRRCVRMVGSTQAISKWFEDDKRARARRSKGIYITSWSQGSGYHGWERLRVWLEGVPMGEMELYLDGKFVNRCDGPPYLLGTEEHDSDGVLPPGEHTLLVRARDGDGWLEQTFKVVSEG